MTENEIKLAKSLGWTCKPSGISDHVLEKGSRRVFEAWGDKGPVFAAADLVYGRRVNIATFRNLLEALKSQSQGPREYNLATDYHVLEQAAAEERTLACASKHLRAAGIAWPSDFNGNTSEACKDLDRDICKSWGV